MTTTRKTKLKSDAFARNIRHRGNVPVTDREKTKTSFRVGPFVLAFFLFVVIGSAVLQIISASQKGLPPM